MKNISYILLLAFSSLFLYSCVGEDIVPEPNFNFEEPGDGGLPIGGDTGEPIITVEPEITLSSLSIGLMVDDQETLTATFLDSLGVETPADILFESDNEEVITIDENGIITAVGEGSANITAIFGDVVTTASVNVVANVEAASQIIVIAEGLNESLEPGQTIPLQVRVLNLNGDELELENVVWNVDNESVVSIDANDILTAIADGTTQFSVSANGLSSGSMSVTVLTPAPPPVVATYLERVATFSNANGYTTNGTATLRQEVATGEITLILGSDFTFQNAIRINLFLSSVPILDRNNRTTAPNFQINPALSRNGEQTFNLTAEGFSGNINSLDHVLVICEPFSLTFGTGPLGPVQEIQ